MKKYKATILNSKGFGKVSPELEARRKEHLAFVILGYGRWIPYESFDFESMSLARKWPVEGREVFECLGTDPINAKILMVSGPWQASDLGSMLPQLDLIAWDLDEGRQEFPRQANAEMLECLSEAGLEAFHDALLERHADSVSATNALTDLLESLGAELVDSGAMYDADGNQEGPRDAVFDLQDDTELACKVYHSPRRVEIEYNYERPLPPDILDAIEQWQTAGLENLL